ncbi:Flp pilus assembly protein CpaB [Sulfuriflexus sp.]|uniref:Flp pilus assembly protein CpaB n=1 Tax=Sulfuriflexus sp. TaxID=2015443 RepID=UPI0028CF3AC8|nr:Flp pilus assembly protein CpaB [Sulfuriflexus sp.]MDT8403041.1 Flp pilus assembly protein CpaB [Sulfuriflexus sp.]
MLAVALIMGVVAVYLVNTQLTRKTDDGAAMIPLETRQVVVAANDIDVGTRLDKLMLKTVDWPASSLPEGYFGELAAVLGDDAPVAVKEIRKGEAVIQYKLSTHGARGGLTPRIPAEKRAVTIAVNEVRGVAGFVLPGDRVDVMLTSSAGRKDKHPVTRTLLQNIMVLGVDQLSSEKEDTPKVVNAVTLLVMPEEGKKLTLAQSVGDLNLMLRNEGDVSVAPDSQITLSSLKTFTPVVRKTKTGNVVQQANRRSNVNVIRGLSITQYKVDDIKTPAASGGAAKTAN